MTQTHQQYHLQETHLPVIHNTTSNNDNLLLSQKNSLIATQSDSPRSPKVLHSFGRRSHTTITTFPTTSTSPSSTETSRSIAIDRSSTIPTPLHSTSLDKFEPLPMFGFVGEASADRSDGAEMKKGMHTNEVSRNSREAEDTPSNHAKVHHVEKPLQDEEIYTPSPIYSHNQTSRLLPQTPVTPGVILTPASIDQTPENLSDPNSDWMERRMEVRIRKSKARVTAATDSSKEVARRDDRTTGAGQHPPIDDLPPQAVPQIRAISRKKSFSDKFASLKPLLMGYRSTPVPGIPREYLSGGSPSTGSSYSPGAGGDGVSSRASPMTAGGVVPDYKGARGSDHTVGSPKSAGGRSTKPGSGRETTYIIQVNKTSPTSTSSSSSDNDTIKDFPEITIVGPSGDIYSARANIDRDRLELVRLANSGSPVEYHREISKGIEETLLATLSMSGGLGSGVKHNPNGSLARDVIIVRSPSLTSVPSLSEDVLGERSSSGMHLTRPRSKTEGKRVARPKRTKVIMGQKPGSFGNHTLVTPDGMFEWAQGSKLSKCIDLSTKRTVAKLESRIFHRDKFVLSSESEPLGPMLLLSACKIWWQQHARHDFRMTA